MESMMSEVPLSLIESNILPRLPAKSVGRFMCVCKQWKSFLSTPAFARMHLHHVTINDCKLLLLDDGATFRTFDGSTSMRCNAKPDPPSAELFILDSLDGLICLALGETSTKLAFWNPLTGAYKKLSSSLRFDFNMITCDGAIGFYVDSSSNDYKLLCLLLGGLCGAFIYSNRLDSWTEIKVPFQFSEVRPRWSPATFWSNCLYFIVRCIKVVMICFDVKKETFRRIRFPSGTLSHAYSYGGSLAVLNGRLHLCESFQLSSWGNMWRMDDDDGWVKVVSVCAYWPLASKISHHIYTSTGDWLAVLEENKDSFEKMNTEDFLRHYNYFRYPSWKYRSSRMMYVETLVSPNP